MTLQQRARQWAREPLVHFLLGGLLIFAYYSVRGEEADPSSRTIDVTPEVQAQIALNHERMMQRPPTDAELDVLIERYVREEVLYREALRLGLDSGDPVVRRRLAKKMDFLAASSVEASEPGEAELEEWYSANAHRYAADARLSFDQVYFAERPDGNPPAGLSAANWQSIGEPVSLPASVENRGSQAVAAQFGEGFAGALLKSQATGEWTGPVESGVGWHYVRLRKVEASEIPTLESQRTKVIADWRQATAVAREDEAYRLLRDAYTVEIDR